MIPRRRDPIGLYLHIPFCDGKCPYCDFYSLPAGSRTMDDYCGRLISELFLWGEKCPRFVDTLYFGGGTPSLLGADRLSRLITAAQKAFSFVPGAEITVEMNPLLRRRLRFSGFADGGRQPNLHRASVRP